MLNFIKYEIKGTYKYILGVVALVLVLITGLFGIAFYGPGGGESTIFGVVVVLSVFVLFGTALSTFIYIVGSFRKELYEDRGYLTFTLPLTGSQIVASKLIVALLWFIALGLVIFGFTLLIFLVALPSGYDISSFINIFKSFIVDNLKLSGFIYGILVLLFSSISMLVLIYFSMAISKVTFKNNKIGGLWFLIYIVLVILIGVIQYKISEFIPYYFDLQTFRIQTISDIGKEVLANEFYMEYNNGLSFNANLGFMKMNIASSIYNILVTLGLFAGTGYLIDNKIDL